MNIKNCPVRIDMTYRDFETGVVYHVIKVIEKMNGDIVGFELMANKKIFTVKWDWLDHHIKSKRLQYVKQQNSDIGFEYNAINKTQSTYVILNK